MAINDFDQAARFVARQLNSLGFLQWLRPASFHAAWVWTTEWLDTQSASYPGEDELQCDTVTTFQRSTHDAPPLALVIEFMSTARTEILVRLTRYILSIHQDCTYQESPRVRYEVIGSIVNLTGVQQSDTYTMTPPDADGCGLVATFQVRNLASESAVSLLQDVQEGKVARSMLVWAPLMREADTAEYIALWRAEVEKETDAKQQSNMVGLAKIFSELAKRRTLWADGVQGMNDVRSQVTLEWEARAKLEGIAIGEQRGIVIGEQRGIVIGEQRGVVDGGRAALFQCLQVRFDAVLPDIIQSMIERETELARLESWLTVAFTAPTLDGFILGMK